MIDPMLQAELLLLVLIYCAAQTVHDWLADRRALAACGAICTLIALAVLMTIPMPTHAVKIDLPIASSR